MANKPYGAQGTLSPLSTKPLQLHDSARLHLVATRSVARSCHYQARHYGRRLPSSARSPQEWPNATFRRTLTKNVWRLSPDARERLQGSAMAEAKDTLHRQLTLLRLIPEYPRYTSSQTLHEKLHERGFKV